MQPKNNKHQVSKGDINDIKEEINSNNKKCVKRK